MTPRESICYAIKYPMDREPGFWYAHIFNSAFPVHLSDEKAAITKIRVRESQQNAPHTYWGWWDNKKRSFTFVHSTRAILNMVFPYGFESEMERGRGQGVEVEIEELGTFTQVEAEAAQWRP